jgi:hypothetical protein
MNPNELKNFSIKSYKKISHLPLSPQLAEKIRRLSTGEERHVTNLIPEGAGTCIHGNYFNHQAPKEFKHKAKIITGNVIIPDVTIHYLQTGNQLYDRSRNTVHLIFFKDCKGMHYF